MVVVVESGGGDAGDGSNVISTIMMKMIAMAAADNSGIGSGIGC